MDSHTIALVGITLFAATVNGALGYGFSSLTVPVALFFLTNRVLNPALVPIEVVLNAYVLWVNRASIPNVWRRTMPIVIALAPGVSRLGESSMTAVAYAYAGLYSIQSMALIPQILPSLLIGVPIGAKLIRHLRPETFRRICMSFDAWVVAFGLSGLIRTLHLGSNGVAYGEFFAVVAFDLWLLYRFFFLPPRTTAAPGLGSPEAAVRQ